MFRPKVGDLSPDSRHYWDGDVWQWRPLWLVPQEAIDSVRHCFRRPATAAHLLATGLLNQSWRVETHDGTYVLRVSRSERSAEQLAYEHTFILALKEHLRIVVPPLAGRGGKTLQSWQRRLLSLFPFVEGTDGTAVHPEDRMRAAATVLAEIRRASLTLSPIGQRPGFRSVDEHPRWIWLVLKPILSRDLAGAYGFDDLFAVFDREIERLDVWLDHLRVSGRLQPRATVHGDFNPRNLIFDGGRLVAMIDWDECHADSIAWEVAQVGFGAPEVDPVAFWDAYLESGGPLTSRDCAHLGGFAAVGALTELQRTTTSGQATSTASSSYAMSWRLFLDFTNAKHPS